MDDSNNPFDTGYGYANAATGVFRNYIQANKYALPEWNYKNIEWYAPGQLEGQQEAHARLWRALLLLDAAVGHDAAGLQLPARQVRPRRRRRGSSGRCASARIPAREPTGAAWTRGWSAPASRPRWPTPWKIASSAASCRARTASTAPSRPARASTTRCRTATSCSVSPRLGFTYDVSGNQSTIFRGGFGHLLRPPAGQPGLRHDRQRARRAQLHRAVGTAAGPRRRLDRYRPVPDVVAQPLGLRFRSRRRSTSGTSACSASSWRP